MTATTNKNNVYLTHLAKDAWNDIQAYHIETSNAWRSVALVAIVALMMVSVAAMYMVNQDKHKILVFERDNLGNLTALGLATKTLNVDNRIIAHQLANFIIAIREVPQDVAIKRRNINLVHKMLDSKLREGVDKTFIARYSDTLDGVVIVGIESIKPMVGGKSWEVRWHESSIIGASGRINSNWSAVLTFKRVESITPDVQLINPTGIIVTYFYPVEDINDKAV